MHRLLTISRTTAFRLVMAGLLASVMAVAQERDPGVAEGTLPTPEVAPSAASSPNPSSSNVGSNEQDEGTPHSTVSYDAFSRALTLQSGWKRTEAFATYAFTAPTSHLFRGWENDTDMDIYGNSIAAGANAYLTGSKATALHFNADLEMNGQAGYMSEPRQAAGQDFTVEWGLSHLFSPDKYPARTVEIDVAGYEEWLISRPLSLGGPFGGHEPGYSLSSVGLAATFTLPEKNIVFSLRCGREHLVGAQSHSRIVAADVSWTW